MKGVCLRKGGGSWILTKCQSIFLCLLTKLTFVVRILLLLLIQLEFYYPLLYNKNWCPFSSKQWLVFLCFSEIIDVNVFFSIILDAPFQIIVWLIFHKHKNKSNKELPVKLSGSPWTVCCSEQFSKAAEMSINLLGAVPALQCWCYTLWCSSAKV